MELLVALAVTALAVTLSLPPAWAWAKRQRLESATRRLAQAFVAARWRALTSGRAEGLALEINSTGDLMWTVCRDGDGDGLRQSDITTGIDPRVGPPQSLSMLAPGVRPGVLAPLSGSVPRLPPQAGALQNPLDPIKFGSSGLAVFSALGGATPGSIYLHDSNGMTALVVNGVTGRLRLFRFDFNRRLWKEMS